jgi:hypothetical protein
MFKKKQDKTITDYFERRVLSTLNDLDVVIYKEQQKIAEEYSAKGMLQSGMVASAILRMINDKKLSSCKEALNMIDLFQTERNITIPNEQLDIICDIYASHYNSSFLNNIEHVFFENVRRYIGEEMANSIGSDVIINNTPNQIIRLVNDKINDIKVHNKIQRDEPSVIIARRGNKITLLSLIVSVVIGIATLYFTFFNK